MATNETRVIVSADTGNFNRNIQTASASLRSFGTAAAASLNSTRIAGVSIAAAGAGLALLTRNAINAADAMGEAAERTGASTESLSALRVAARLSATTFEEVEANLIKLAKAMEDARDPASKQAAAFSAMGIAIADSSGKLRGTDEVFAEIAQAFSTMPDGAAKTALALQLFGKSGAQLIPLLNQGKAGLEGFRLEAERLGVVVSEATARDAGALNDNIDRLGFAAEGAGLKFATGLLPALQRITAAMGAAAQGGDQLTFWGQTFGNILLFVSKGVIGLAAFVRNLGTDLGALAAAATFAITGQWSKVASVWEERNKDIEASNLQAAASIAALSGDVQTEVPKVAKAYEETAEKSANAVREQAAAARKAVDSQIADQKRLVAAVRGAMQDSLDAMRDFEAQAQKLRADATAASESRAKQAEEKRLGLLPAEEQETVLGDRAREQLDRAELLSAKATLAALAGDTARADQLAGQALAAAEEAARTADRLQDIELGANLIDAVGEIESEVIGTQAKLAERRAADAEALAGQQGALLTTLQADLDALVAQSAEFKLDPDITSAEAKIAQLDGQITALKANAASVAVGATAAGPEGFATGGMIRGPGSDTSDNILARLSPGEYIVRAAAVRKYGAGTLAALNAMRLPKFADGGLVAGLRVPSMAGTGGASPAPAVFNFPGMGSYPVSAAPDVLGSLKSAFAREALKRGRR